MCLYKPYLTHTPDTHMRTVYLYSNTHLLSIRTLSHITTVLTSYSNSSSCSQDFCYSYFVVEELEIMGMGRYARCEECNISNSSYTPFWVLSSSSVPWKFVCLSHSSHCRGNFSVCPSRQSLPKRTYLSLPTSSFSC